MGSPEIWVEYVSSDRSEVFVRVMNTRFRFRRTNRGNNVRYISKGNPDAQVHDPNACWVPDHMYQQARRLAKAILMPRRKEAAKKNGPEQPSLFGS